MKKVGLIMGSASDLPIVEKAMATLGELGVPYETHVYSAHRCPDKAADFARNAEKTGFAVLIGFAGMAAHLAGALAANTVLPVIGVPCKSNVMDGVDALLSTVMMPSGIPVACVAVDGGVNAALLAAQIIAVGDEQVAEKLRARREKDRAKALASDAEVAEKYNK